MKPVLYLAPGLLCDETVWSAQIAALGGGCEIRVPVLCEFDSIAAMAQSILDVAPPRFAIAGHSMGARVALEALRRAPERVERIALLDTGVHPAREGEQERRMALVDLAMREGMAALAARWLPPMVHPARLQDEAFMRTLTDMVERMTPAAFRNQVQALLTRPNASSVLSLITCPALIGVGRQDGWSPPAQHEPIAAAVPHARYAIFEDSGHMAPIEAPEAVTAALHAWLEHPA